MRRVVRSEWCKLLRLGQVLGTWGTMVGLGVVFTVLLMANAGTPAPPPPECTAEVVDQEACAAAIARAAQESQRSGPIIPIASFEAAGGWVFAFNAGGQLLGIVALVAAAANLATEYTSGTLKGLLVREPRRTLLLGGKIVAVWGFVTVGIAITLVATVATAVVMALARGIAMDAWASAEGVSKLASAFVNVTVASAMWSLLGTMLAMVFRSGPPAIGIGISYPILVEGLLALVVADVVKWMPGQVLAAVGNGPAGAANLGGATPTALAYPMAMAVALVYVVLFLGVSMALLKGRDVT